MAVSKAHTSSDNRHIYGSTSILNGVQTSPKSRALGEWAENTTRKRLPCLALALSGADKTQTPVYWPVILLTKPLLLSRSAKPSRPSFGNTFCLGLDQEPGRYHAKPELVYLPCALRPRPHLPVALSLLRHSDSRSQASDALHEEGRDGDGRGRGGVGRASWCMHPHPFSLHSSRSPAKHDKG